MPEFHEIVNEFLEHEFETNPVMASGLGLTNYDDGLDDLSEVALRQRDTDAEAWHQRFSAVDAASLSPDDLIDRDQILAVLAGRRIAATWEGWRRDPVTYSGVCSNGVFTLWLHRLRPEKDLVESTLLRLAEVPRVLDQGKANIDPAVAHPLIVQRGIGSARGAARYFRDLVAQDVSDGGDRARVADAGAKAADALEQFAVHLEIVAKDARGSWVYGEERYSRALRERESLQYDARGLRELGQAEYDRLDREMGDLAQTIAGTRDWNAVLRKADEDHPRSEEEMRATYADWTERSQHFLVETGLVTLPEGEKCLVEPSPVFQRPLIGVASYNGPPAFSEVRTGHFFVPFAPDGTSEEERQERLKSNSNGGIPTTAVHEAYPGHHWHILTRRINAPRVRRVYGTPYFSEGWALYAERVMRERGFFTEPIHELYHLEATIFRAARIVVDTSLHMGEMSYDEAVTFMQQKAGLPEPTAKAEVGRYCWWPTQASSYLTGCLEILRIRDRWLGEAGAGGQSPKDVDVSYLRRFHDALASSGSLPLGLAERAVMPSAKDSSN
jgi:uncharacterized protein (DUF885 family)